MKRILTLGIVLALMAALVIPGAVIADSNPTTQVSGTIGEAAITVTAPSAISFVQFVVGDNIGHSATNGTVTVTPNSRNETAVPWSVTANDTANGGFMKNGGTPLNSKLLISKDGSAYAAADAPGLTYTGNGNGVLPFWAKQNIVGDEAVGTYSISITFTGNVVV